MNKNHRKKFLHLADAFFAALIFSVIAYFGWFDEIDGRISDKIYQRQSEKNPDIIVIGIDQLTLNKLGSRGSIPRRDFAKIIRYLNNHDSSARPSVIGIDGLFTGENFNDLEGDKELAEAAAQFNNVVIASEVYVDDENISANDSDIYEEWSKTWEWIPPFPALAKSADTGHINAPNEEDGIARHDLLFVNTVERGKLFSFARIIYEKDCLHKGIEPDKLPQTKDNGIFYLPFTAKSYATDCNFSDLLEGKVDSEVYRDKIVLIGPYAPGFQDSTPTALDRSDVMYGIDIHANAIEAFQKGFFPVEIEKTPQLIILFVLCFIAEWYFRSGKMRFMIIIWLTICLGWIVLCKICYQHEIILHVIWIPVSVSILFIGAVATNYIITGMEKDKVTATFGRYVDPTILKQILEGDSDSKDVGGKLRNIAVLFVDIRGFTTMSEKLPPSTVVKILNRYFELTTECIRRHHGTLDKFVGDCTMAFWNAPVEQKNSVYLACSAALDMIKSSEKFKEEIYKDYGSNISFGVGVHCGSAIVGNIGTPLRMDYTAIGDTVNTAARLESNAKGGTILISRVVADILGSRANVTSLGNSIKLKGKAADFEILQLNSLEEMEENK